MKLDLDLIDFEEHLVKKQLKESSRYQYIKVLQKFLIGKPDIHNIEDYNDFIIKECIYKRKSHVYSILLNYIKFKITDSSNRNKMTEKLIRPKSRKDIKRERIYLKEEEILSIIQNLEKHKHKVIAIIMHLTGIRIGGAMKIKDGNIQLDEEDGKRVMKIIVTDKGGKRNVPYIYDNTAQEIILNYLQMYPPVTEYYFLEYSTYGNRGQSNNIMNLYNMNYKWFWLDLNQALTAAGVDQDNWAPHDYRRCFARRAYDKFDKDIQVLKNLLNHQNVETTLKYLQQSGLPNRDYYKEMQK